MPSKRWRCGDLQRGRCWRTLVIEEDQAYLIHRE